MMSVTDKLVTWFVPTPGRTSDPEVRPRYGALEAWVSIVVNTLMAAVKFALGWWISSVALIADAGHTLSDTLTSIVVLVGFRTARRPVDREHPHGHGRMESIATLIIATLLAVVGIEFLIRHEPALSGYYGQTVAGTAVGTGVVHFHVTVDGRMELAHSHEISHRLDRLVCARLPACQVTIHMEPKA
jgi:divalent metal cation (Fe/Co/Zn/Cd) transporter